MKVRHKMSGYSEVVYDVYEESPSFYIGAPAYRSTNGLNVLPKRDYEPVPAETWRDVTGECEVNYGDIWHSNRGYSAQLHKGFSGGYRLRKVQLRSYEPIETGDWKAGLDFVNRWAFIVEKREP